MSLDQFLLSADTTDLNYPEIRPTLDLNFARTKTLDPRITFTRASSGSYFGADGLIKYAGVNEPRFDHNPVTGESLGLLVEGARTNLYVPSIPPVTGYEYINNTTITANQSISPDGTTSASLVTVTGSFATAGLATTLLVSTTYTASIYAKQGSIASFSLIVGDNGSINGFGASFNLNTLTAARDVATESGGGVFISASIVPVGGQWFRCTVTGVTGPTLFGSRVYFRSATGNYYLWGAQLEAGSFPTSYIPTTGSTVTRSADNASITGTNFSSWYNSSNTFSTYCEYVSVNRGIGVVYYIGDITDTNRALQLYEGTSSSLFEFNTFPLVSFNTTKGTSVKTAFGRLNGNNTGAVNGVIAGTSAGSVSVLPDRLYIGGNVYYSNRYLSSTIKRLTYWPKRLPNAQLQALTR